MFDPAQNHFEIFGLTPGYGVDNDWLATRYRELQRVVHPDRHAGGSERERRLSIQGATRVNEAYQVLRDPLARGCYLLELNGVDLEKQSAALDPDFLMEQMALREDLAEAGSAEDPYPPLDKLHRTIRQQSETLLQQLASALQQDGAYDLEGAAEALRKLQFMQKLRQETERLEADLDEVH